MNSNSSSWRIFLSRARYALSRKSWSNWLSRPVREVTLVVMAKGHGDVRKIRLSPNVLWSLKWGSLVVLVVLIASAAISLDFVIRFPQRQVLSQENQALRKELNNLQYNLDSLQVAVDRMGRFDQKLRALTEVDKEFSKLKGPEGQGGSDPEVFDENVVDFGDFKIDANQLEADGKSVEVLDRRQMFLVQKLYSWMGRLFHTAELQDQSLEELFEVLKGREAEIAARPTIMPTGGWPTSHFGFRTDPFTGKNSFHRGMDVAAREGAPVIAPADGVVTFAGAFGTYGNAVQIFHGYGLSTLFAHTSKVHVNVGQKVHRGDLIAEVGNSGRSTGSHLHYEVIVHGVAVDPRKYVLDRTL